MSEPLSKDEFLLHMTPLIEKVSDLKEGVKELAVSQREQNGRVAATIERVAVLEERSRKTSKRTGAALPIAGGSALIMLIEIVRHLVMSGGAEAAQKLP